MGFCQAAVTCVEKQGIEPPHFEDHTLYSNKGMEDLLDIDEITYTVLYGTKMNVATEPLKRGDPPPP